MNELMRAYEQSKIYKKEYPKGTRVELINMSDPHHPVPSGSRGTVDHVDDAGKIYVKWDRGGGLPIVPEEDVFRKLTDEEIAEEERLNQAKESENSEDVAEENGMNMA